MTIQQRSVSPVYRRAYACGRALKRVFRRVRTVEAGLAERAGRAGVPAGKVLVHGGFLVAALVLIAAVFYLISWAVVLLCVFLLLKVIDEEGITTTPEIYETTHPLHRTYWPELYDEWGSLK